MKIVALVLLVVALAGCGTASSSSSKGVVGGLQDARELDLLYTELETEEAALAKLLPEFSRGPVDCTRACDLRASIANLARRICDVTNGLADRERQVGAARRSDDHEQRRVVDGLERALEAKQGLVVELVEPEHVRAHPRATLPAAQPALEAARLLGERRVGDGREPRALTAAAFERDVAVDLVRARRVVAGAGVQSVHVLRDQQEALAESALERGDGFVRRVRVRTQIVAN